MRGVRKIRGGSALGGHGPLLGKRPSRHLRSERPPIRRHRRGRWERSQVTIGRRVRRLRPASRFTNIEGQFRSDALVSKIGIRMDRHFWRASPIFLHWQQVVCFSEACECPVQRLLYYRGAHSAGWRPGTLAAKLSPEPLRCRLLRSSARVAPPNCAPLHRSAQTSDPRVRLPSSPLLFCAAPSELFRVAAYSSSRRPRWSRGNPSADAPIHGPV